jgi:hypothetical protein
VEHSEKLITRDLEVNCLGQLQDIIPKFVYGGVKSHEEPQLE